MKNTNRENINRRLVFAVTIVLLALPSCHQVNNGQIRTDTVSTNSIVFEGTVEKLGPDLGFGSGVLAVYRLAKYRVDRVCEGKYDGSEIVVDHLIFTAKEFEGIKVNDRVCLRVQISNNINTRYNAEGIRSPSDDIKIFYTTYGDIQTINGAGTCCDGKK